MYTYTYLDIIALVAIIVPPLPQLLYYCKLPLVRYLPSNYDIYRSSYIAVIPSQPAKIEQQQPS